MSKTGTNNVAAKQENNTFKKDSRGSSGNTSTMKEDKRSDSYTSPSSQGRGRNHHDHNDGRNRDRSGGRHDSRHYDKSTSDTKSNDREDKTSSDPSSGVFGEKKFTGRCRLFVGNLTPDVTEEEFRKMFEAYGEISEVYVNTSRGFGFIRLDYRHNAEAAKAALDGLQRKGRILRVRFATHGAALKVKNLHPFVSNELLEQSFSQFGDLERCVVIVDDKGKPTGEGIVEFVRKPGANSALRRITEGVFLIGADPKPVAVEPLEHKDEEDGMPEKFLTRTEQYKKEREKEPRFAPPGTFEYEFGMRWKQVEELEKQRIEQVKKDTEEARLKLEDEMQNALYDYQAEQIRQELVRQQEELRRLEELRNADRLRRQQEHELRRQQDDRERAQQEERRRADAMMMLRQQDLARGRGPLDVLGLRGADDFMMGDRYGDRMGDRMPDRLADRMPDRMSDRMGPGQPGFMWDEKQRGEAVMRGDAGRGRGSGAPSGQPPSGPPSAVGIGERGGPAASAAGGAAQGAKSSPKPLMQGSGFGNVGSAPGGGGPGSGAPGPADANAMDESCSVENDTTQILTTEEWPPDGVSSEPNIEADVLQQDSNFWPCTSQAETEALDADVDLLGAHADHRSENGYTCADNSCLSSSDQSFDYSSDGYKQNMSDHDLELPDAADRSDINSSPVSTCQVSEKVMQTTLLKSFSENVDDSSPHFISHVSEPHDDDRLKSTGSVLDCSDNGTKVPSHSSQDSEESDVCETMRDLNSEEISVTCTVSANSGSFSTDSHCGETLDADADSHLLESSAVCNDDSAFSRDAGSSRLPVIGHSDDSNHTLDNSWYTDHQAEITGQNCGTKQSAGQYETASLVPVTCTATSSSECFSQHSAEAADDVAAEQSECPTQELSPVLSSSFNQNSSLELYRHSLTGVHQLKVSTDELESEVSCKQITENEGDDASLEQAGVSSYMQHIPVGAEEMDVEVLQEEVTHASAGPDVCESLEDVKSEVTEAGEGQVSAVSVNGDNLTSEVQQSENPLSGSSQVPKSDTSDSLSASTSAQITADDAASSVEDQVTPSSASPSLSSQPAEANCGDQDRLFAQGDQAFISTAARQPSSVPFMPPGCSLPYVPGIGPSMYGGPAIVPGMPGPTVLTSSSVHIAQHPGGATIMQHQSMSTGLTGGLAHASVVQQQAMPNGVQSTSVLQRTLTNGGQTMVVQQRTMTTGLDGVTQQTVVQQQVAAPAITPAALFHANAMRQRTLMQQRGIRFIRTGVPVMHAQTLGGASLIPGAAVASAPLLGHGLLRGVSQGAMMQQLVRQRYLGGPVMPGRGVQLMAGRPIRVKMTYPRESMPMDT